MRHGKPTIRERREREQSSGVTSQQDFMDVLLDNEFTDDQINYLFLDLIGAATDTSVSAIDWLVAELIKIQKSMKRARDELAKEINKDFPKEWHLNQLPYPSSLC